HVLATGLGATHRRPRRPGDRDDLGAAVVVRARRGPGVAVVVGPLGPTAYAAGDSAGNDRTGARRRGAVTPGARRGKPLRRGVRFPRGTAGVLDGPPGDPHWTAG